MSDKYQSGQIYYASVFHRTIAAATGLGVPIFNIQAPNNGSVRLREVVLGAALGSTTILQQNTVRFCRNATAFATEGGVEVLPQNAKPWQKAGDGTQGSGSLRTVAGITAAAAATEGGRLLYSDTMTAANANHGWRWDSWTNGAKAPWADNSANIAILLHATDATVVNASVVVEVMSRNT